MNEPAITAAPNLTLRNGQPVTTSLDVAERFGKQHKHVLTAIQNILGSAPEEFSQPNFGLADYLDAQKKPRPMYQITKDGFALLAMGFTGQEALNWKILYITAFNRMAEELAAAKQEVADRHFLLLNDILSGLFKYHPNWPVIRTMVAAGQSMSAILQAIHRKSPATVYRAAKQMADHGLMVKGSKEGSRKKCWGVPDSQNPQLEPLRS